MGKIKLYRGIGADTEEELKKYINDFYDKTVKPTTYGGGSNLGDGYYFTTDKREAEQYAKGNDYKEWKYSQIIEIEVEDTLFLSNKDYTTRDLLNISPEFKKVYDRYNDGWHAGEEGLYQKMIKAEDEAMKMYVRSKGKQGVVSNNQIYNIMTNDFLDNNSKNIDIVNSKNIDAIKPPSYWEQRTMQRLTNAEIIGDKYRKDILKVYDKAIRDINKQIDDIYRTYAKAGNIDTQTLKELLPLRKSKALKDKLKEMGLENSPFLSNYDARLSRLEELQANIYIRAKEIYGQENMMSSECYKQVVNNSYLHGIYDTQVGTGLGFSFSNIDDSTLTSVLGANFQGKNFSSRIWANTDVLAKELSNIVGAGIMSGIGQEAMVRQIRTRFDTNKYYAKRLVRTEVNHFNNEADNLTYNELNVEKYVFLATLDNRTSNICQDHDNKRYDVSKKESGVNFPPLHPNCRSTTRAYISEDVEKSLERRARNPITGQKETVGNISYSEWLNKNYITSVKNGKVTNKNNIKYNIESLGKLDKVLVDSNINQLNKLLDKYPKINDFIKTNGLEFGGEKTNVIAVTSHSWDMKHLGIHLSNDYYKDVKHHNKLLSISINNNEFMNCNKNSINVYALNHEFGHLVEIYLINEYNISNPAIYNNFKTRFKTADVNKRMSIFKSYERDICKKIAEDINDIALKNNKNFDVFKNISQYGTISNKEFFAECFANMESGKPNELGMAMKKYLKRSGL